jgi:hypothetical protein
MNLQNFADRAREKGQFQGFADWLCGILMPIEANWRSLEALAGDVLIRSFLARGTDSHQGDFSCSATPTSRAHA